MAQRAFDKDFVTCSYLLSC